MESDYREEALAKLVDNGVSLANMGVWIAGYIAGRKENDREVLLKYEASDLVPINELWIKNKDGTITKTITIG
jgi:hypothetical protein